jgi:hypothetical protein
VVSQHPEKGRGHLRSVRTGKLYPNLHRTHASFSELCKLASFIERNQAEIDKVEGELASRAKDVSYLG